MSETHDFDSDLRAALGDAYQIERELAGSGMSRVFVAIERALNRQVVIKVLPPELAAGVNRERFRREIQLAAQLQHPHIVPLHTAGMHGDLLFFTMPFIEGESLRQAVHEGVRFSPRDVVRILHDVADALAYAHARGVIHRDIKPGNVLRSGSHAMVTDFGVAKAISASLPKVGTTSSGMAIGTPQYMAPEQLAGDPAADHRVDIYALGLLGYELLAGEAPFKAPSPQETMAAQLTRIPEPISRTRPDVPPALATLLARCLAKNPADRPQTAAEVAATLGEMDVSTGSAAPYRTTGQRSHRWIIAAAFGLAAIALAAIWMQRRQVAAPPPRLATGDSAVSQPVLLTHDDSMAIARAIEQKLQEQRAATRARQDSARTKERPSTAPSPSPGVETSQQVIRLADSLRGEIQRAVLDSVARVRGVPDVQALVRGAAAFESLRVLRFGTGPRVEPPAPPVIVGGSRQLSREAFAERRANLGPPRRTFVSWPVMSPRARSLEPTVLTLVDSLRQAIARNPRFLPIDADSSRAALQKTRSIDAIADLMNVDLFVSLYVGFARDSSVVWSVTVRDLGAIGAYSARGASARAPADTPLAGADSLVAHTVRALTEVDLAPRRAVKADSGSK